MRYRTVVKVASGRIYDLASEHPPRHDHPALGLCSDCRIVDAWTEPRPLSGSEPSWPASKVQNMRSEPQPYFAESK